ncbi:MAG TPA: T9SS type A sorting domain-containing protein [Bacteroidota bacterium]|nr:T9SS type A sorting domain-containing protein [Bacteroidota bacterium]
MKKIFLLTFTACSVSYSQSVFDFPFETGSAWQYQLTSSDIEGPSGVETFYLGADTVLPNHRTYKPFFCEYFTLFYLRKDSSKIYQFWPFDSSEILRYDFSKKKGDIYSYLPIFNDSLPMMITRDTTENIFGVERRLVTMSSHNGFVNDDVVDSIGLYYWWDGVDPEYRLKGASISGRIFGSITPVRNPGKSIPQKASLSQNYPNPFNPSTTIEYAVPASGRVRIFIINRLGQRVAILVDGFVPAGLHRTEWNASKCPSGIYFCTMEWANSRTTRVLVLLK